MHLVVGLENQGRDEKPQLPPEYAWHFGEHADHPATQHQVVDELRRCYASDRPNIWKHLWSHREACLGAALRALDRALAEPTLTRQCLRRNMLAALEAIAALRAAIGEAGGTPVEGKLLGDGILSVYPSARQAIDAAQRCRDLGNEAELPLHLGIHAGDVVREGNNVHGGAVQLASRVQSAAAPGETLVSDIVRGLARTPAGVQFEDRGEHELKDISEPQRLFAVKEQD